MSQPPIVPSVYCAVWPWNFLIKLPSLKRHLCHHLVYLLREIEACFGLHWNWKVWKTRKFIPRKYANGFVVRCDFVFVSSIWMYALEIWTLISYIALPALEQSYNYSTNSEEILSRRITWSRVKTHNKNTNNLHNVQMLQMILHIYCNICLLSPNTDDTTCIICCKQQIINSRYLHTFSILHNSSKQRTIHLETIPESVVTTYLSAPIVAK